MAHARGKQFEKCFADSIPKEFIYYRLKDAPPFTSGDQSKNRFTPSNICDAIVANPSKKMMWFVELKETSGASLPFGNINFEHAKKMRLMVRNDFSGALFLIRFNDRRKGTFAIPADTLLRFKDAQMLSDTPRKSYSFDWIKENGIEIPERILKTNYRLDLSAAFGGE